MSVRSVEVMNQNTLPSIVFSLFTLSLQCPLSIPSLRYAKIERKYTKIKRRYTKIKHRYKKIRLRAIYEEQAELCEKYAT